MTDRLFMKLDTVYLRKNKQRRIQGGHLWAYSNEIDPKRSPIKQFFPGQQIHLRSHDNKLLGTGYVNPHSLLCVRLFSRGTEALDRKLLDLRIRQALSLRSKLFTTPYYRLVYGESDLLPGLIVDRFGGHLSVQFNTAGIELLKDDILTTLKEILSPASILLRNDSTIRPLEGLPQESLVAHGNSPEEVELVENGVRFLAPLAQGQKTGWFYDQRCNRAEVSSHAKGRRVLDVFSYIGSFSIQAGVAGASEIWAVDSSRTAIELAEKNSQLNGIGNKFTGIIGDAFDVLKGLRDEGEDFDIIVVDPPAFIKRKKDHQEGFGAYHRINELAVRLLKKEGLLLTASCSMHLRKEELLDVLRGSVHRTGRHAQVLFHGSQGPDHPVHPAIPETHYLKAYLAQIINERAETT